MLRVTTLVVALLASLLAPLALSRASAQAVHLDHYRAAETAEDGFAVSRPNDLGHLRFSAQLHVDYALDPLVYERQLGDATTEQAAVVAHQLVPHLGVALGLFDRLVLFAGLSVNAVMIGEDLGGLSPDGSGLGDTTAGLRLRLLGERDEPAALSIQGTATFPTAQLANDRARWSGDDGVTAQPEILGEVRIANMFFVTANVGVRFRITDRSTVGTLRVRHELTYGLGLRLAVVRDLFDLVAEGYGATTIDDQASQALFARESSPFEVIGGLRLQPVRGLFVGLAAGTGITRGYGAPDLRGVLTVGYAMPHQERATEPEPTEPAPPSDLDGDGVLDPQDRCPSEPEDDDLFQDDDGCPDPDNDGDTILDGVDQCPSEPEDLDQMGDEDGCIDSDNDADGLPDVSDRCPNEPEDRDRFEDEDGCIDPDNDGDGVLDAADQCAFEPGHVENNGCPFAVRLDRETGQIRIMQRVEFATGGDRILPSSMPVLEEVRSVIAANPQILRVRIEGHTDDRGNDRRNLELSTRRARSVMRWLAEHGIVTGRLEGQGCGELHALEPNRTRAGRQANRRVEFHVVDPAPPQGVRALEGCTAVAPEPAVPAAAPAAAP